MKYFALLTLLSTWAFCKINPNEVAVLACEFQAESRLIAKYYSKIRKIPKDQILELKCRGEDQIARDEYLAKFQRPVLQFLKKFPDVKYLVTTKGMPLKIESSNNISPSDIGNHFKLNAASLESELMAISSPKAMVGWLERPPQFTPKKNGSKLPIVMRLDGSDVVTIKNQLKAQIAFEKSKPLGDFCIDTLNLTKKSKEKILSLWSGLSTDVQTKILVPYARPHPAKQITCLEGVLVWGPKNLLDWVKPMPTSVWWTWTDKPSKGPLSNPQFYPVAFYPMSVWPTYQNSFPEAADFFTLLLTGRFSLGEALNSIFIRTSWLVTFLGDPMYTPFKSSSVFSLSQAESYVGFPLLPPNVSP
jgi:hypothetical protein